MRRIIELFQSIIARLRGGVPPISRGDVRRARRELELATPEERLRAVDAARDALRAADRQRPEPPAPGSTTA